MIACLLLVLGGRLEARIIPSSSTAWWTPILYAPYSMPDAFTDQQSGLSEGDIVGNLLNPSFYVSHHNGGATNTFTDGQLGFRFRFGADKSPAGYKGVALVGINLALNGSLDLFAGVNRSGSMPVVGLWWAAAGTNSTPGQPPLVHR